MFTAIKVGATAFKVGKLAANTSKVLKGLLNDVKLWEIQINYYTDFFNSVRPKIPPTLYLLCLARIRVVEAYIENLREKIKQASKGSDNNVPTKVQMKLIGKASGEMGLTFAQDIEIFFLSLEESYSFCLNHIALHQVHKVDLILAKLEALGTPVEGITESTEHINKSLSLLVQSRRLIFLLESPPPKVAVEGKIKLVWTTAGDIPHVDISIQVSSFKQQAQDKAKKSYVKIAEKLTVDHDGIGHYEWVVPHDFVKRHGKHGYYQFKISYSPPQRDVVDIADEATKQDFIGVSLMGKPVTFDSKVKVKSDTFKIHEPKDTAPKTKEETTHTIQKTKEEPTQTTQKPKEKEEPTKISSTAQSAKSQMSSAFGSIKTGLKKKDK